MKTRPVTYAEASRLLSEWGDRRLIAKPDSRPIDFSLEDACDGLCRWIAEDPDRSLEPVPEPLLRHLRVRILFAMGVCALQKDEIIGRLPANSTPTDVLAALFGMQLAETRLPPEWRLQ